jgi:Ca2+:H+ antiporter
MEVAAVLLAAMLARMVAEDGESNWLEGAMLLMIYAILGTAFFFLPETRPAPGAEGGPHHPSAVTAPRSP